MYAVIPTLGIIRYVHIGSFPQTRLPVGMITYIPYKYYTTTAAAVSVPHGRVFCSNTKAVVGS